MPAWQSFVVLVLVVLVAIAPRRTLGPVAWWTRRVLGAGVIAVLALSFGSYLLLRGGLSDQAQWMAYAALGLGGACAAWWIYRRFVPAYRDQAREPDELA
jgi:hypothetical protein